MKVNSATYGAGSSAIPGMPTSAASNTQADAGKQAASLITDVYDKSKNKNYKIDYDTIDQIKSQSDVQLESFRELVRKLLLKQSGTAQEADMAQSPENPMVDIDAETRAAAQELVSEDGYFGVKKTSERLLSFAKAVAGDDPDKIEKMRSAVEQGFKEAEKLWGGELPEISKQTYDAVMKGFDEWSASATSVSK